MRNTIARSSLIVALGAALLGVAAPIFLFAAPQAKTPTPVKKTSPPKKSVKSSRKRPARPRAQKAPTPERIREIQSALAQKGFYEGEPSGKWDARTVQSMKKFQQANGLTPTGKMDAKSLQKLGLGSEVAGVASPRARSTGKSSTVPPGPQ